VERAAPRPAHADGASLLVQLNAYRAASAARETFQRHCVPAGAWWQSAAANTADATERLAFAAAVLSVLLHRRSGQAGFGLGVCGTDGHRAAQLVLADVGPEGTFRALQGDVLRQLKSATGAPPQASARCNVTIGEAPADPLDVAPELAVVFSPSGAGDVATLQADASIAGPWLREFADQCRLVAEQARQAPATRVGDFTLVTASGAALLPELSTPIPCPRHAPLVETILDRAREAPSAPAVECDGRSHTYDQLRIRFTAVAQALIARGVRAGDVVAVTGARSFGVVAAMLGVMQAGGVLLTLDPRLPVRRRTAMVEQARARWLVKLDGTDLDGLPAAGTLAIASDGSLLEASPPDSLLPTVGPDDPAYLFFTSGSTGTPKAVLGRHGGLAHFLAWQRSTFEVGPGDRASQLTALSFDVVLRDTFLALGAGATLCIPDESDVLDPSRIVPWLRERAVTTIHVVPSLARLWLDHLPEGRAIPSLRRVFFAGEPLTDSLVERWRARVHDGGAIVNLYGPTETTLAKCWHLVPEAPQAGVQPIGRPLPQTQVLILDAARRLCGLDVAGEIAIRTPFRTLGYLDNPTANATAFVRNPARDDPEDLVYLTGDSGRLRSDGLLEIRGRIDNQIKIRGVRIEPAEVEACLARHPRVAQAVVVGREDARGDKRLVAYVVERGDAVVDGEVVQGYAAWLRERLAEPMVPSAFVRLERLPLNANGKVDKRALPEPGPAIGHAGDAAQPESELHRRMATVWQDLLGVSAVGIDDNFFDIGGHSLLAVQAVRLTEAATGVACTLPDLFAAPTIRALARRLEHATAGSDAATVIALRSGGSGTPFFCVCGIHLYRELAHRLEPESPVYGIFLPTESALFDAPGATGANSSPSVEKLATDYLAALREVQPRGPYRLVGVSFGGVLAFEMAQQLAAAGERVELLAMLDSMLPRALRRNWARWLLEHLRKARREGTAALAAKLRRRLARAHGAAPSSSRPVADENQRLQAIRQAIYKTATARYAPRRYAGRALLVRATDPGFFESDIADPSYGWADLVAELSVREVPGDHLGILRGHSAERLAHALSAELDHGRQRATDRSGVATV